MAGILNFDASKLAKICQEYGVHRTWISLLAAHVSGQKRFDYILESEEFSDFVVLDEDLLKGLSVGEISVLYEFSLASEDFESRKSKGQFFTPDDVAEFMSRFSADFPSGIWLDPCSGIGNLSWHLASKQADPEKFIKSKLLLSDVDTLALLIDRVLLTVSFQNRDTKLFDSIRDRFITFDFLSVSNVGDEGLFEPSNSLEAIPAHDYVIVNPPYLAVKKDPRFETADSADLYAYFLENIIKTSKGFVSITPQSFTNARKFRSLRRLMLANFANLRIFSFDNVPANVFLGIKFGSRNTNKANSIRAAVCVALPGEGSRQVTSLVRWTSVQRQRLFKEVEKFLSEPILSEDFFPKVNPWLLPLYNQTLGMTRVSSLCTKSKTDFVLYVPSAPRYFISALKNPVQRASMKEIYFPDELSRDTAYLLLNSSLMYWWWRVRDGGMTLSLETVLSAPVPDFDLDCELLGLLEQSEKENKVYKKNAGVMQENVKHPKALVEKLNWHVLPSSAQKLMLVHENSEFAQLE